MNIPTRDDSTAVDMLVKKWNQSGDKSIIQYYKRVGERNEDTSQDKDSDFKSEDFLLVMQSADQDLMMKENPHTVCVDATHGLTG